MSGLDNGITSLVYVMDELVETFAGVSVAGISDNITAGLFYGRELRILCLVSQAFDENAFIAGNKSAVSIGVVKVHSAGESVARCLLKKNHRFVEKISVKHDGRIVSDDNVCVIEERCCRILWRHDSDVFKGNV